jgi:hypothetical protein
MSKICILTSYTDHIRWDNYGKCDYGDFSSLNHHEYSNKHGYSYIKEIVKNDDYLNWHPTWIKIDVIKKYLPLYDYVVWIDADAVFVNQEIKIEDMITDNVDLVIPKLEVDRVSGNMWTHTTTGFMIWKNSEWSNNLLNKLWDEPNQFKFEFFHEQSRLDELIYENFKLEGGDNILNKTIDDIEFPVLLGNIRIIPFSYHRYWEDGVINYVYHAGGDTPSKLTRIKKILK